MFVSALQKCSVLQLLGEGHEVDQHIIRSAAKETIYILVVEAAVAFDSVHFDLFIYENIPVQKRFFTMY